MVEDNRVSRSPKSGVVTFTSGDAGTAKDLVPVREEVNLSVNGYLITYSASGTTNAVVELYDDVEGTSAGNLSGKFDEIQMAPGDQLDVNGLVRSGVTDDIIAVVRNNDDEVSITVGAMVI
jgi:hypothetical protein